MGSMYSGDIKLDPNAAARLIEDGDAQTPALYRGVCSRRA